MPTKIHRNVYHAESSGSDIQPSTYISLMENSRGSLMGEMENGGGGDG